MLIGIDGHECLGKPLKDIYELLRGRVNTPVALTVCDPATQVAAA